MCESIAVSLLVILSIIEKTGRVLNYEELWMSVLLKKCYVIQGCLVEMVNAILYNLKIGFQHSVKAMFGDKVFSHGVMYYYNK